MDPASASRPSHFWLSCPRCRARWDTKSILLFRIGRPCIIQCKACHRSSSSRGWRCKCDVPWIACTMHRADGFACQPVRTRHARRGSPEEPEASPVHKRRKCIDVIRQLGASPGPTPTDVSHMSHVSHQNIDIDMNLKVSLERGLKSEPPPPPKRRILSFSPGPLIARKFLVFSAGAD